MDLVCTWLTGPDAGGVQRVTWRPGDDGTTTRVVIGRAGAFCCDDPGLLAHHVVVEARAVLPPRADDDPDPPHEVEPTRVDLWATRLAGRAVVRTPDGPLQSRHQLARGTVLQVASSTCRIDVDHHRTVSTSNEERRAHRTLRAADDVVVRTPRAVPSSADLAVVAHLAAALGDGPHDSTSDQTRLRTEGTMASHGVGPPERERPGGLVPTLVGLVGSTIVALVTRRPMFLLFGALGSTVALSSWVGQWVAFGRRHRHDTSQHRESVARDAAARAASRDATRSTVERTAPSIVDALETIAAADGRLWACRRAHPDAFMVTLGLGDVRLSAPGLGELSDAPVCTIVGPAQRLALLGPLARPVARAIVAQVVARCGPADLRLVVVTSRPREWHWVPSLPHAQLADASDDPASCLVDTSGSTDVALVDVLTRLRAVAAGAHVLVVTDEPHLLVEPSTALRHAIDQTDVALVVVADRGAVPSSCTAVLDTNGPTAGFVASTTRARHPLMLRAAGIGERRAVSVAQALAGRRDPEVVATAGALLPSAVSLTALVDTRDNAIATRWHASRHDDGLATPIGVIVDRDGVTALHLDLVRDGPHTLIAGTTGSGKSELLRSLVVGLALAAHPDDLAVVLVDYKGGAAFDVLGRLPHVVGTITDLDDHLADRMLRSLRAELRRREHVLRDHGASDLRDLHRARHEVDGVPPRLVLVVDEFAALVAERPSFLHALVGIAQRGRSLGLHLVLATQRPAGVVSDDIRANTSIRVALRLHDRADALDVVGDEVPTTLPRHRPGRAVLRDGERSVVFQSAQCTDLPRIVEDIVRSAAHVDRRRDASGIAHHSATLSRAPWLPPLPEVLDVLPTGLPVAITPGVPTHGGPTTTAATTGVEDDAPARCIGVLDDPDHQRYVALVHDPRSDGLIVAGSSGSGVSSTLAAVVATSSCHYDRVFVLEASAHRSTDTDGSRAGASGGPWTVLDHRGDVDHVDARDRDRLVRVLHALAEDGRYGRHARARTLLVIDGLDRARRLLDAPAHDPRPEHRHDTWFEQLLGAVLTATSLDLMVGTADPAGVPPPLLARCGTRWVHHLVDPHAAGALGIPVSLVPPRLTGRLTAGGLVGQVLAPAAAVGSAAVRRTPLRRLAPPAPLLTVDDLGLPHGTTSTTSGLVRVAVGIDLASGECATLTVGEGDHVMVIGPAGSGRSTAVTTIGDALRHVLGADRVVIVDDADRIDDRDGALARLATDGTVIVAAGRGDALRQRTGHWSTIVRRSRTGLVLAGPQSAADGDLLGIGLPRGCPVDVRPGRGWLIDHGEVSLVQIAVSEHGAAHTAEHLDRGRRGSPNLHR